MEELSSCPIATGEVLAAVWVLIVLVSVLFSMAIGTFIWHAIEDRRIWQRMDRLLSDRDGEDSE